MSKTYNEYDNARAVDYNRWSEHPQVDKLVLELVAGIENRKIKGYILNMKIVVMNLYYTYLADPTRYVSYYRGKPHYNIKNRRKHNDWNPILTRQYFTGSVDELLKNNLITNKEGYHVEVEQGEYGDLSKMRATPKLVELWRKYGVTPDMIGQWKPDKELDVITLKSKTKKKKVLRTISKLVEGIMVKKKVTRTVKENKPLKLRATAASKRMSGIIQAYNRLMDKTHIDCDAACISDKDRVDLIEKLKKYNKREQVIYLHLDSKHVHRVFNEGDRALTYGGRYYGAWWIGCPGELRKYITLNGNPSVELDYSSFHIHLLYALKGINYAKLKGADEDAYNLVCKLPEKDPDRKLNKLILLTALNADDTVRKTSARDSVYNQLRKDKELKTYNLTSKEPITQKLELLRAKHAPIAEYIASGMGLKLQYYDSCIIEKLIQFAVRSDIPILTVHDSVICEANKAVLIRDKMFEYFTDLIREKLNFHIRYTKKSPHAKNVFKSNTDAQSKSQLQSSSVFRRLAGLVRPPRVAVEAWLRPDDLIVIDEDVRTNACSGECNHSKRLKLLSKHRKAVLGTVTVKLIEGVTEEGLLITE